MTISPGVTGTDLMEFFLDPDNDVCMESDALIATLTYGGVLMTGCHVSRKGGGGQLCATIQCLIIVFVEVGGIDCVWLFFWGGDRIAARFVDSEVCKFVTTYYCTGRIATGLLVISVY